MSMVELWKPMLLNNEETGYFISSYGNVKDCNQVLQNDKFKKFEGHYTFDFKLNGKIKRVKIHRIVASTFIDNPHTLKNIKHIDNNPFNNTIKNLKWVIINQYEPVNMNNIDTEMLVPKFKNDKHVNKPKPKKQNIEQNVTPQDEIWKEIYIEDEISNYDVSNYGRVRVRKTLQLRSLCTHTGYKGCTLIHKDKHYNQPVHRLVSKAFIPNDDKTKIHINHIDYNKLNNHVSNLEWVTVSENNKHAHQHIERKSTTIPIIRMDMDGTNPVRYESQSEARKEFGSYISNCLNGSAKQAYGYLWTYENKPEQNIDVSFFKQIDNHPDFLISIDGQIYNKTRNSLLTPRKTGYYMSVVLDKKHYCIHRLLATYFIDKPENYNDNWIVNHIDGNKLNNHIDNLEWLSASDNTQHAYDNGARSNTNIIIQKDLNGNIVGEYINATHASRVLNFGYNINSQILTACKNPKRPIRYGYRWEFKNET